MLSVLECHVIIDKCIKDANYLNIYPVLLCSDSLNNVALTTMGEMFFDAKAMLSAKAMFKMCFRAQWLSSRVLDWRSRGCGFKSHCQHCVVSLSKILIAA